MKRSAKAMSETFLLSNIIPQDMRNNSGVWNRIEQQVREWAKRETSLIVITGPIYSEGKRNSEEGRSAGGARYIGATKVRVPDFIYKVILDETPPRKMIAFIAPNADTKKKPWQLVVTVDEVEEATGMDFFGTLPKEEQGRLESALDLRAWDIGERGAEVGRHRGRALHRREGVVPALPDRLRAHADARGVPVEAHGREDDEGYCERVGEEKVKGKGQQRKV